MEMTVRKHPAVFSTSKEVSLKVRETVKFAPLLGWYVTIRIVHRIFDVTR